MKIRLALTLLLLSAGFATSGCRVETSVGPLDCVLRGTWPDLVTYCTQV